MKPNESTTDRSIRIILGGFLLILAVAALGLTNGETLGIVVGAIGAILVFTAAIGFCPAYKICGLSTCKVDPTRIDSTQTDPSSTDA